MVISFFRIVSFCDHVLEKEKSGMARFWRVVPRADGAKGLSKCISGWFVCNAGYELAGVIVVCVEGDVAFEAWTVVGPIVRDDKVGFLYCRFLYCLVNF